MEKLIIEGNAKLSGKIEVGGAKNAVLPLMAAGILVTDGKLILNNVPNVLDVETMRELLDELGLTITYTQSKVEVESSEIKIFNPSKNFVSAMRASVLVMGPLLGRYGKVISPLPGGCAIGERPIDQHLSAFKAMGAKVNITGEYVELECESLRGADFTFKVSTVTGTENAIMAGVFADGVTVLHNCAKEPEVVELVEVLNRMGAKIKGAGTETIEIKGVTSLKGIEHKVMPDRIEAGTYIIAGVLAGDELLIQNIIPEHVRSLLAKLKECGADFTLENHSIRVKGSKTLVASDVITEVYPGFPTDLQAQYMALMCFAKGRSAIKESIFENRFQHVAELRKMGADIVLDGGIAYVNGGRKLKGATVRATDLRASACLVIAGLGAEGITEIEGLEHLDRGYEKMEDKLFKAGARIKRVKK